MRDLIILIITTLMLSCTVSTPYSWQDTREPARDDATADLEKCRSYAAKQYRPGMPTGDPYLKGLPNRTEQMNEYKQGEWRPDRSPFQRTNINALPIHKVPVDYTGYPGELDYYPDYLDDILENCMNDKGWAYQKVSLEE